MGPTLSRTLAMSLSFLFRTLSLCLLAGAAIAQAPPQPCKVPPPPSSEEIQAASKRPADRGFLWRIEKDDRASWLYGTMHVGTPDGYFVGSKVRGALRQSDTLALELDLADPDTAAVFTEAVPPALLARLLTPERQRRLDRQVAAACLPPGVFARVRPVLQVTTLAGLALRQQGLRFEFGSEHFLGAYARSNKKPLVALETARGQLQALIGDDEAEETRGVDEALDQLESGHALEVAARLAAAWARSDWAELDNYRAWCDCVKTPADERALRRLLDDRNPGLANGIAALHDKGQRVFAAVGALHMVGAQGLPTLLAARGFTVARVLPAP
ncbi:MAG: TraB/GumN family protein [Comamonadaceae bacterium]|nr:MAG: TraB/GumN family protein [Comamonadaceae bacterium]